MNRQAFCSLFLLLTALLLGSGLASAQQTSPQASEAIMWKYRKSSNATFVQVGETALSEYGARYCRTLTLRPVKLSQLKKIEKAVATDREEAKVVKEVIDKGRLVSGYYEYEIDRQGFKSFLIYVFRTDQSVYLITLSGKQGSDELAEQLRSRAEE
ncbi:hypothetical protein PORCAN_1270 [Porphyromonas crevioricanis JCM 13913]|nr:hypothetical protein PORCAN_1270 [Porphyromonas crevioricanis JCM 13913]